MFLDKPEDAVVVIARENLAANATLIAEAELLDAVKEVLREEDASLPVFVLGDWAEVKGKLANLTRTNRTKAIVADSTDETIKSELIAMGYVVENKTDAQMRPVFQRGERTGKVYVEKWEAVGMLSAPLLSPSITKGYAGQVYQISGPAPGRTYDERFEFMQQQTR